jgi:hypothetical protein
MRSNIVSSVRGKTMSITDSVVGCALSRKGTSAGPSLGLREFLLSLKHPTPSHKVRNEAISAANTAASHMRSRALVDSLPNCLLCIEMCGARGTVWTLQGDIASAASDQETTDRSFH